MLRSAARAHAARAVSREVIPDLFEQGTATRGGGPVALTLRAGISGRIWSGKYRTADQLVPVYLLQISLE